MAKLCIKEVAESKGVLQSHLQIAAAVTPPLLNRYWNNKTSTVDLAELEKIAKALGVEPGELIVSDASVYKPKYKSNDSVRFLDMKAFADTAEEVWIHGHIAAVLDEFEEGSRLYSVYSETNDEFYDVPEDQLHMLY